MTTQHRTLGQVAFEAWYFGRGRIGDWAGSASKVKRDWETAARESRGASGEGLYEAWRNCQEDRSIPGWVMLHPSRQYAWDFAAAAVRTSIERPGSDAIVQKVLEMIPQKKPSIWRRLQERWNEYWFGGDL